MDGIEQMTYIHVPAERYDRLSDAAARFELLKKIMSGWSKKEWAGVEEYKVTTIRKILDIEEDKNESRNSENDRRKI